MQAYSIKLENRLRWKLCMIIFHSTAFASWIASFWLESRIMFYPVEYFLPLGFYSYTWSYFSSWKTVLCILIGYATIFFFSLYTSMEITIYIINHLETNKKVLYISISLKQMFLTDKAISFFISSIPCTFPACNVEEKHCTFSYKYSSAVVLIYIQSPWLSVQLLVLNN